MPHTLSLPINGNLNFSSYFSRATRVNYLSLSMIIYLYISLTTDEEKIFTGGQLIFTGEDTFVSGTFRHP